MSADTIRDSFFKWLSKQVSSAQLSDFFTILDETEAYCLNKRLIDGRLFEITDPEVIRKLSSLLEGNRLSRLWGYGRNKKRLEGLRYYASFLEKFDIDTAREKNNTGISTAPNEAGRETYRAAEEFAVADNAAHQSSHNSKSIEASVTSSEDQVMECSWESGKVDHSNFELWLTANESNSGLRAIREAIRSVSGFV